MPQGLQVHLLFKTVDVNETVCDDNAQANVNSTGNPTETLDKDWSHSPQSR